LVDDGEPVVLSKKIRRALKIKDEHETLEAAITDDLKAVGIKREEVLSTKNESEEDSAERRKRKMLYQGKCGSNHNQPK